MTADKAIKATICCGVAVDAVEALNKYCRKNDVKRSHVVEIAIRRFLLNERGKNADEPQHWGG